MRDERSGIGTGIVLITVGLLFMADRQGYLSFSQLWPVILIVLGAVMLLFPTDSAQIGLGAGSRGITRGRGRRSRVSRGIWLIFVGSLLLANQNQWLMFRDSWPLFIVAGGLAMIFGSVGRRSRANETTDPGVSPGSSGKDVTGGGPWR